MAVTKGTFPITHSSQYADHYSRTYLSQQSEAAKQKDKLHPLLPDVAL